VRCVFLVCMRTFPPAKLQKNFSILYTDVNFTLPKGCSCAEPLTATTPLERSLHHTLPPLSFSCFFFRSFSEFGFGGGGGEGGYCGCGREGWLGIGGLWSSLEGSLLSPVLFLGVTPPRQNSATFSCAVRGRLGRCSVM